MFKYLKPLFLMQIKEKTDFSFLNDKKALIQKIVYTVGYLILMTVIFTVIFIVSKLFNIFALVPFIPISVIILLFSVFFILSTIVTTIGLTQSLFFSKDNVLLLTLPVTHNHIFFSKLLVYAYFEIKKVFAFLFPLFVAYGIVNQFVIFYYPWLLVSLSLISLIPVLLGALFSMPAMLVTRFLNQFKLIKLGIIVALFAYIFYQVISLINLIPSNINLIGTWGVIFWRIQDFLAYVQQYSYGLNEGVYLIVGKIFNYQHVFFDAMLLARLGFTLLFIMILILLNYFLVKPLFFKITTIAIEYDRSKVIKQVSNKVRRPFASLVYKEVISKVRSAESLLSTFLMTAILPTLLFFLNRIYGSLNTSDPGKYMVYSFTLLIGLLIVLSSNIQIASTFSKEGAPAYVIKTFPQNIFIQLFSRVMYHFIIGTLSIILTGFFLKVSTSMTVLEILLFLCILLFMFIGHALWSAELDLMNPQNKLYDTSGYIITNPNEKQSTIWMFVLSFIFFAILFFLLSEGTTKAFIKVMLLSLAFLVFRGYLIYQKLRIYFKEKS